MSATNADNAQAEVIAFLKDPASYPGRPESVDTIETHGAIVFMAGGRAYKMKRAVRLPYLDFSTLEKRRAVCRREIEINRPMAPRIYRDVVTITRETDGRLALGGKGEPVEYAVEMSRFDQSLLFDRMAARGALDRAIMARLADRIADSHAGAPVHRNGGAQALGKVVAQVANAMSEGRDTLGDAAKDGARRLQNRFAEDRRRLEQREQDGFVRRCHGDLHLRNIVLLDGEPTLFDAIEFDEEIAIIDILYDFAFLLMDLWRRGHQHLANAVFNRYLWRGGAEPDIAALGLMPLFLALRAGVRMVVALDRMDQFEDQRRAVKRDEARGYFTLAGTFLSPPPPRLIAVGGLSGTGKSTLAAVLAPSVGAAPGALHLRSDVERKLLFGRAPEERLGEDAYSPQVTQRVYAQLAVKAEQALAAGHSVIVDAVHARAGEREAAEAIARRAGASFEGLWLTAPEHVLIRRVDAREGDASDADAGVVRRQLAYEIGAMAWRRIDASGTPDEVAKAGLRALKESGAAG